MVAPRAYPVFVDVRGGSAAVAHHSVRVRVDAAWSGRKADVLVARFLADVDALTGMRFEGDGAACVVYDDAEGGRVDVEAPISHLRALHLAVEARPGPRADAPPPVCKEALVLTFVSEGYLPLLELWLEQYYAVCAHDLLVVALDAAADAGAQALLATKAGARVVSRNASEKHRASVWRVRLEVLEELVRDDASRETDRLIIHSDVDAFWLGDAAEVAMGAFASSDGAVAAFSQDHGTGLNDKTFSLCPGWFAMRSPCAGRAQSFVAAWRGLTDKDDQVAVNKLYGLQLARRTRGLAADHSVAVLGYGAFQRCDAAHKPPRGEVKVWHPWLDCAAFSVAEKVNVWRPAPNRVRDESARLPLPRCRRVGARRAQRRRFERPRRVLRHLQSRLPHAARPRGPPAAPRARPKTTATNSVSLSHSPGNGSARRGLASRRVDCAAVKIMYVQKAAVCASLCRSHRRLCCVWYGGGGRREGEAEEGGPDDGRGEDDVELVPDGREAEVDELDGDPEDPLGLHCVPEDVVDVRLDLGGRLTLHEAHTAVVEDVRKPAPVDELLHDRLEDGRAQRARRLDAQREPLKEVVVAVRDRGVDDAPKEAGARRAAQIVGQRRRPDELRRQLGDAVAEAPEEAA